VDETEAHSAFVCLNSWYTKARKIAPKNGRPYNQLAILALCTVSSSDFIRYS